MVRSLVTLLVLIASVDRAHANMGQPYGGGEAAGEPVGITDVAIVREELVIDLRPLVEHENVKVSATYHLDNAGPEKALDLVFAAGSTTKGFAVTLDGKLVESGETRVDNMPESWNPPKFTPTSDGGQLGYEDMGSAPIGFHLVVPPGRHDVSISYSAASSWHIGREPTIERQFAYVLAPARTWAGFGGLELTVLVPTDWEAAVTPALKRTGDTLHGVFSAVPADAVAITVRATSAAYAPLRIASLVLFLLVTIGGLFGVVWWTLRNERQRLAASKFPSGVAAFGRGIAWGAAFLATGLVAVLGPSLVLPEGEVDTRGQGYLLAGVVLGAMVVIPLGWVSSYVTARSVHTLPANDSDTLAS